MTDPRLTDEAIIPVMDKFKISREEAEKRLTLLFKSDILSLDVEKDDTKRLIDRFLAQDSTTLQVAVNYERALNECLSNKDLVRQYDRLYHCNLTKAIRKANAGLPPANFKRQIEGFERFLEATVFSRMEQNNGK